MNPQRYFLVFLLLVFLCACQGPQPATKIEIPALFTDHMVLQQKSRVPIWGTANPNGMVKVEFDQQRVRCVADSTGKWQVKLKSLPAGGPFEMKIIGRDTLVIQDILVGEVWLGSGQSNMEMPIAGWGRVQNYEQEISTANYPHIRLFQEQRAMSLEPIKTALSSGWKVCTPEKVADFSATEYFFGRTLHQELNVPIGLIHSSWGGTPIETWISAQTLEQVPDFHNQVLKIQNLLQKLAANHQNPADPAVFDELMQQWRQEVREKDRGLSDPHGIWSGMDVDTSGWRMMKLPATWENEGLPDLDGVVWFRKEVELPATWQGQDLTLHLSAVDDIDSTYFNGIFVGSGRVWDAPRAYVIPRQLVKIGRNVITVRVEDNQGGGGIWGDPNLLKLDLNTKKSISLVGEWNYKVGLDWQELSTPALVANNPNLATVLSNAMIEPLIPYAIRGAIWYQGESNTGRAYQYRTLFPDLIRDWRQRWGQGDFPFLFVQLANFMATKAEPAEDSWAELREAQLMTLSEPNTGMAVTIDIGDTKDIHPKNKQEVGRRLALNALKIAYDRDLIYTGPTYKSMQIGGDKIRLLFDHTGNGLITKDGTELKGFAVAGGDHKFYWATAKIDGNAVIVWSSEVKNPVAVRYAWASNPICNLYNSAGLPASPFRSDDWRGITAPKE